MLLRSNFSSFPQYFLPVLDFHVQEGTRISLRDKRLYEINEVEITRVNCNIIDMLSVQGLSWLLCFTADTYSPTFKGFCVKNEWVLANQIFLQESLRTRRGLSARP